MVFELHAQYIHEPRVTIQLSKYISDNSTVITLCDDMGPMTRATVSLLSMGLVPAPGHVFIKDYSENEGLYEGLKAAGIVGEQVRRITVGHAVNGVVECELLIDSTSEHVQGSSL